MREIVIQADNLGKQYSIGETIRHDTIRDAISHFFISKLNRQRTYSLRENDEIWALKGVTFNIYKGEVVGIIGRNGAGKSTLLKILSRITDPTEGSAEIRGEIGSLLEVGTGFHPELTGRENIFMNGSILGMKRREIFKKLDQIVDFAEVSKFVDTPVKHYSSGMYLRLAFAVAAHLETEILLIDEVLAVGDLNFQRKCLDRMGEVAKQGRTVLFVSHNLQAISTLTSRAIVLNEGNIVFDGDTYSALSKYRSLTDTRTSDGFMAMDKPSGVVKAMVVTSEDNLIHRFGEPLIFDFEIKLKEKPKSAAFSFQIIDESERPIVHLWVNDSEFKWSNKDRVALRCTIQKPRLYMGRYKLRTYLADRASLQIYEVLDYTCYFEVVMDGLYREYDWVPGTCAYLEEAKWELI